MLDDALNYIKEQGEFASREIVKERIRDSLP